MISSVQNEKVKNLVKLQDVKNIKKCNEYLVMGLHLVEEADILGLVKEVILLENFEYETNAIKTVVSESVMKKISGEKTAPKIMAVVKYIEKKEYTDKVLLLDDLQDPGNLGTIIRSAVAFGFGTIVLSKNSVNIFNNKVLNASEGMIYKVNIFKDDLLNVITYLKEHDYSVIGTSLNASVKKIEKKEKLAIVIGNEGNGVSKEVLQNCTDTIKININENCESLNAAVAASILMYEVNNG